MHLCKSKEVLYYYDQLFTILENFTPSKGVSDVQGLGKPRPNSECTIFLISIIWVPLEYSGPSQTYLAQK